MFRILEEFKEQQRLLESQQQAQSSSSQSQQQPQRNQGQQLLTQLLVQQLQQESRILDYDKPKGKDSETPKSEKDYITFTSICPSIVYSETDIIAGISVENSIYNSLKMLEVSCVSPDRENCSNLWCNFRPLFA